MYDINLKNVKKGKGFYSIFLIVGLLFLVILISVFVGICVKQSKMNSTVLSSRVEINSYVNDEGTTMYSTTYYYTVNNEQYICNSSGSSSNRPSTKNEEVYYDSDNPEICMTKSSIKSKYIVFIFLVLPISFILLAVINMRKINNRIKLINELNQRGKLIKNLPYRLENTGMSVNNIPIQRPVVDYKLSTGSIVTLYGDPRHDKKHMDSDGFVDLLIDESNPNNYYIDFEINRLTGNLKEDYNDQNSQTQKNDDFYNY